MDNQYLARIATATDALLADVAHLDDADVAQESLLPGWDRAMLLTHLAAHAEAACRALDGAARGEVVEFYPGGRPARDAEIDAGRGRPAAELRQRLVRATEHLADELERADDRAWQARTLSPEGEVEIGPRLIVGRLREVLVHHVDLRAGYTPEDWPTAWVMEEMDRAMLDLPGRLPAGTAVVLEATDVGQRWVAGSGDEVPIAGTTAQLFAWLTGRAPAVAGQDCPLLAPWR